MKKKVLFLIESLSGGGAEKVLSVFLRHLKDGPFDVTVCPIVDSGVYRDVVRGYGVNYSPVIRYHVGPVLRFFNRLKYKLVYSWLPPSWVYKRFVPKGNDVEVAFCEGFVTKLLARSGSKTQKIAWVHTDLAANPWPVQQKIYRDKEEERLAYLQFDKVVCVSGAVETVMRRDYGLDNTVVIDNPVDADAISALAREESPVQLDPSCFNVVAVGRLVPQKGFDELVRIVANLVEEIPNLHLYIVGEGPERPRLEEMAAGHAKDNLHLTGYLANPYALMSRADVYVCSSRAEGFSLTVAEAMVLEIPVISTNSAGPAELLGNGRFGELCGTYQELSAALKKAAQDKDYLVGLRNKSREGKGRFDKEKIILQFKNLLETASRK